MQHPAIGHAHAKQPVTFREMRTDRPRDEEWLLIEWPKGEAEPTRYFLSTLPEDTSF